MPSNERDDERAARALADAHFTTDAKAAAKHGISTRSIERYRARLDKDTLLSGIYDRLLDEMRRRPWADELNQTLTTALRKIGATLNEVPAENLADVAQMVGLTRELMELELSRKYAEYETRGDDTTDNLGAQQTQGAAPQADTARLLS